MPATLLIRGSSAQSNSPRRRGGREVSGLSSIEIDSLLAAGTFVRDSLLAAGTIGWECTILCPDNDGIVSDHCRDNDEWE